MGFVYLIIYALMAIGLWKVFEKMGKPGWQGIVPIYNFYILTQVIGKPAWWIIVFCIPFVNIIACIPVAQKFGKGTGFGVGLALLGFIFYPILGFGDAKYMGAAAAPAPPVQTQ